MPCHKADGQGAARDIPNPQTSVVRSAGEECPIRGEADRAYDAPARLERFADLLSGHGIPQPNGESLLQLQSNRLIFSSPDYYNDPFDTFLSIDFELVLGAAGALTGAMCRGGAAAVTSLFAGLEKSQLASNAIGYSLDLLPQDIPDVSYFADELKKTRSRLQQVSYSLCFCNDPLNESLWAKYANSHKGFVQVYELDDSDIYRCEGSDVGDFTTFGPDMPTPYPVYYSDEKYDATYFALALRALGELTPDAYAAVPGLEDFLLGLTAWEMQRVSLIKKRCHEHDGEWRVIHQRLSLERPDIRLRPSYIVLGLKMPEYERRLVISAALVAQVTSIREAYIDSSNNLSMREVDYSSDLLLGRWARTTNHTCGFH